MRFITTRVLVGLLATLLVLMPLLFGGRPAWVVASGSVALVLLLGVDLARRRWRLSTNLCDRCVLGLLGWTGLQMVPLPPFVWELTSPARLEVLRTRELAGVENSWVATSLDPGGTMEAWVVGAGLTAAYLLGRNLRHRTQAVVSSAALSALALGSIGLAHELLGAELIYGVVDPGGADAPRLLAPIVNENHLSAFLGLGAHLWLALALRRDGSRRWVVGAIAASATCAVLSTLPASRGGLVSLLAGYCGIAGWTVWRRRRGRGLLRGSAVAGIGLVGLSALGLAYGGLGRAYRQFEGGDYSKFEIIGRSFELALSFPVLGIGRGGFETVFTSVEGSTTRFTHPENLAAQWTTEWGLLGLAALIVLALTLSRAIRSRRTLRGATAIALGALVLHDQVDFALETAGIGVIAGCLLGVVVPQSQLRPLAPRWVAIVWVAVAVTTCALAIGTPGRRTSHLIEQLRSGERSVEDTAESLARLHPLDARATLWIGHRAVQERRPDGLRWLNRTMELAPGWESPHALAADALWRLGAVDQALVEIREAAARRPEGITEQACGYLEARPEVATAERMVPTAVRATMMDRLARCAPAELQGELDGLLLQDDPSHEGANLRRARAAIAEDQPAVALRHLDAIEASPDNPGVVVLRARLLSRSDPAAALELLSSVPPTEDICRERARLAVQAENDTALEDALRNLRALAQGRVRPLAAAHSFEGDLHMEARRFDAAIRSFEHAHRLQSGHRGHLQRLARAAQEGQRRRREAWAHRQLCALGVRASCERGLERSRDQRQRSGTP